MKKSIKILLLTVLIMLTTGCDTVQNLKTPKLIKPKIDTNLPIIDHTSIKNIPSIKEVALEWAGTTEANTFGYYIYRADLQKDGKQLSRVATINNRYASHYVDTKLQPSTQYLYSVAIIGKNGTESVPSQSIQAYTLPIHNSVSLISAISDLPRQIKIIWRPHTNAAISSYIIERSGPKDTKWKKITTVKGRLNPEYIDTDLKDNTLYSYRIKAVTYDKIVSKESDIAKATTKPLPTSSNNIEATKNLPKKIIITWQPSSQEDIVAYNIYSSDSANGSFGKLATTKKDDNTFENIINEDNKKRFYKISTIDKDNLETDLKLLPVVMGKTLSAPMQPSVKLALIKGEEIVLNWENGDDRAVSYNVYKTVSEGFFTTTTKVFKGVQGLRFEDKDIVRGVSYTYEIESVDEYGLTSTKVQAASLKMEKLKKSIPTKK